MVRLFRLLMIVAFVAMQGASVEAAICRHGDAAAHDVALHSADKRISTRALTEETAGAGLSKKGSPAGGGSVSPPSDMLPPPALAVPLRVATSTLVPPTDVPALAGLSIRPPLPPPLG